MNIYFKDIHIINPFDKIDGKYNLWLKNGKIEFIGNSEANIDETTEVLDASDLTCAPGFMDMHVHLREPGFEYKEDIKSGSEAAANGGFTSLVCMPNTEPTIDNVQTVEFIKNKSKDVLPDVYIAGAITKNREGKQLSPMFEMDEYGVLMFTDDGTAVMDSSVMRRAFDYAGTRDLLLSQHCEDHTLTEDFTANEGDVSAKLGLKGYPSVAEEIILSRDIMLAEYLGNRRYHAQHISTAGSVELIREAKARGLRVTAEVAPHHFVLTDEVLDQYDTRHKMNPPLRTQKDVDALIEGLADGTIDAIATDHAPHALHEKHVEFARAPYGILGLETALGLSFNYLVHTGKLTLTQLIEKFTVNPRKILQLPEIHFKNGETANMTIFNLHETWKVNRDNFKSKSINTPFNEFKLKGKPVYAINNSQIYKSSL
jgi:dihydroorotase